MIAVLEIVLLSVLGFFLLYLALLSILALKGRKQRRSEASRFRKIAVVVPAHDEELSIEKTLRSLLALDYPQESFDVLVIADNCSDQTATIARSLRAIVYERQEPTLQGKGFALRWCFDLLLSKNSGYEAVVVVDADSVVSKNLLQVMNLHLDNGAQAVQCSDMVEPQSGVWSSEVTRLSFTLYNYVRPLGRRAIRCSAGLRGNGMCFATGTLLRVPWQAYSLAEDLEYGLMLLLNGITVEFAPEAVVYATMPRILDSAEAQRSRWEAGRFPIIREYARPLLWTALRRMSFQVFDGFVDLITPAFANLFVAVLTFFLLSLVLGHIGIDDTTRFAGLWSMLVGVGAIHVIVGLYAADADRSLYKALLYIPRYALWKMTLYVKLVLGGRPERWIRTTRERSVV